jgi:hypothetical protein
MKHDVERDLAERRRGAQRSAVLLAIAAASAVFALVIGCIACNTLGSSMSESAVRAWYLPLGLLLAVLRVGARRNSRRPLSLALFLLGLGALSARAYDARGADALVVDGVSGDQSPPPLRNILK